MGVARRIHAAAARLHEVDVRRRPRPRSTKASVLRRPARGAASAVSGLRPLRHAPGSRSAGPRAARAAPRLLGRARGHPARREAQARAAARRAVKKPSARWRTASTSARTSRASRLRRASARAPRRGHRSSTRCDETLDAEVLRRHVLEQMRLVEDQRVVAAGSPRRSCRLLHREVGAQQVVVHDHDVGFQRALAHARHPAGVELRAGLADAVLAGGRDLAPEVDAVRQVLDLGAVAGLGRGRPVLDRAEERDLVEAAEAAGLAEGAEAEEAEVVRRGPSSTATLRSRPERAGQERDVLGDELLLEVLGAGGDDDAPAQLDRRQAGTRASCRCRCRPRPAASRPLPVTWRHRVGFSSCWAGCSS